VRASIASSVDQHEVDEPALDVGGHELDAYWLTHFELGTPPASRPSAGGLKMRTQVSLIEWPVTIAS